MKVTLATHGGQIAALQLGRPPRILDADALTASQKTELSRLIAAAKRESDSAAAKSEVAGNETKARRGADLMTYTVRFEDDKGPIVLKQSDAAMSPAFAALLDWLQTHLPAD